MSWAKELKESDPVAERWARAAFDALERIGPGLGARESVRGTGLPGRVRAGPSRPRELLIDCQLLHQAGITYVRRCALVGPGDEVTGVTLRCAGWIPTPVPVQPRSRRVVSLAASMLSTAARLLPANDRVRYAEEFRSELWEIAQAGGRRRAQLAYAARQVVSAWRLAAALRTRRRRRAAP